MPVVETFVPVAGGQWVQICEYRETRKSLYAQLSDGIGVFSFRTNTPMVTYNGFQLPAGVTQQVGGGAAIAPGVALQPTFLDLNESRHGDLVKQAWYVWVSNGMPATTALFRNSGTWQLPDGFNGVDITIVGGGGKGGDALDTIPWYSGGGGGGGASSFVTFTPIPVGTLYTFQLPGAPSDNWVSNTGVLPVLVTDGAIAKPGADAMNDTHGAGGSSAAGLNGQQDGGDGADGVLGPFPVQANGGGSGGGPSNLGAPGTPGNLGGTFAGGAQTTPNTYGGFGGAGGDASGPGVNGHVGNLGGGGGGGGFDAMAVTQGLGALGDNGFVLFDWTAYATGGGGGGGNPAPAPPAGTVVVVLEAFDVVHAPQSLGKFSFDLPRLSPRGIEALHDLIKRVQSNRE